MEVIDPGHRLAAAQVGGVHARGERFARRFGLVEQLLDLFGPPFDFGKARLARFHRHGQIVTAVLGARLDKLEQADAGIGQVGDRAIGVVERAAAFIELGGQRRNAGGKLHARLAALCRYGLEHRAERGDPFAQLVTFGSHQRQLFGLRRAAFGDRLVEHRKTLGQLRMRGFLGL